MSGTYVPDSDRYEAMSFRRVGRSGLHLPSLSLGLWHNFGNGHDWQTQRSIVRRAFDLGITHFDLANNYGPPYGSAETNFGRILASDLKPFRDEIVISTKAGYDMWPGPYGDHGSRKYLLASLDHSLERLDVEYVDIFYSHRPDPDTPIEETMGALAAAVRQGKALYVAVSNYDPDQTRAAAAALSELGVPLLIHQPRYSMFDRHIEHGLLVALGDLGVGAIVFSPLAQGLLSDKYLAGTIPADSRAASSRFLPAERISAEYLERASALNEIALARGQSLPQLALSWVLRSPGISSALIGASSPGQLEHNIAALAAPPLTDDELDAIEQFAVHGTGLQKPS